MHSRSAVKGTFRRVLIIISLLSLVTGCGGNLGSGSTTPTPTNNQETPSNTPITSTLSPNMAIAVNIDGLSIQSVAGAGIGCPPDSFSYASNALVLAQNRQNYDIGELNQIQEFVNASSDVGSIGLLPDKPYPAIPDTLQEVLGSLTGSGYNHQWGLDNRMGCLGLLKITNIGTVDVQLSQVSAQLTAVPRQNTTHYRLVNFCMENTKLYRAMSPACPGGPSGATSVYLADFHLMMSNTGTEFQSSISGYGQNVNNGISAVLLQPQNTLYLLLNFHSLENLIYSMVLKLTVDIVGEQKQILLSEIRLAFANADQFSCYDLKGTQFVEVQQSQLQTEDIWCI